MAAKWPPRSRSVHRVMVLSASANCRIPTSWANTIAAVGTPLLILGAPQAALVRSRHRPTTQRYQVAADVIDAALPG